MLNYTGLKFPAILLSIKINKDIKLDWSTFEKCVHGNLYLIIIILLLRKTIGFEMHFYIQLLINFILNVI